MKWLVLMGMLCLTASSAAQSSCDPTSLDRASRFVAEHQSKLLHAQSGEMDIDVPPSLSAELSQLKDALGSFSNVALPCATPSVNAVELQHRMEQVLSAHAPKPLSDDHVSGSDEVIGAYGGNVRVQVRRPEGKANLLLVQYTYDIECGEDNLLQIYELRGGMWTESLRLQSPELKVVGDAFGDFFEVSLLDTQKSPDEKGAWRLAVATGTPWCTSRFSNVKMEVLSPSGTANLPKVLWHTTREYSRGNFGASMKAKGNIFELRINADCMSFDEDHCFERQVVYRYSVDDNDQVRRVNPIALNARGFVSEWIRAPWEESTTFSASESLGMLKKVHRAFNTPSKPDSHEFIDNNYGPVRQCNDPKRFQVEIGSTLVKTLSGKPGGDTVPQPSYYFLLNETGNGYVVLSVARKPDLSCRGRDLMPFKR